MLQAMPANILTKCLKNHTKEPLKCQENACKMSMTIPAKMLAKCQ